MQSLWKIVILLGILTGPAVCQQCNETELDKCLEAFSNSSMAFALSLVDCNQIDTECSKYYETISCIETKARCRDTDKPVINKWLGFKKAIGYRCGVGRIDYLRSQMCLGYGKFIDIFFANCPQDQAPPGQRFTPETACDEFTHGVMCAKGAVAMTCGKESAMFVGKIAYKLLEPETRDVAPNCPALNMMKGEMPQSKCNSAKLDECLENFKTFSDGFAAGTVGPSNIEAACSAYNTAVRCVMNEANCHDLEAEVLNKWLGRKTVIGYNCGAGRQEYLGNLACLSSQTFLDMLFACKTFDPIDKDKDPYGICSDISTKLSCLKAGTLRVCDEPSANYVSTILPWILDAPALVRSPSCSAKCNETMLDWCLQDYTQYADSFLRAKINADNIEAACSAFYPVENCVKTKAWCMDSDAITKWKWTGDKWYASMFCGEMKEEYLKHQQCLDSKNYFQRITDDCFQESIQPNQDPAASCSKYNEQMICSVKTVHDLCGPEAAKFTAQNIGPYFLKKFSVMYPECTMTYMMSEELKSLWREGGTNTGIRNPTLNLWPAVLLLSLLLTTTSSMLSSISA